MLLLSCHANNRLCVATVVMVAWMIITELPAIVLIDQLALSGTSSSCTLTAAIVAHVRVLLAPMTYRCTLCFMNASCFLPSCPLRLAYLFCACWMADKLALALLQFSRLLPRRCFREVRYVLLTSLLCDVATPVVPPFILTWAHTLLAVSCPPTKDAYGAMLIIALVVAVRHDSRLHASRTCITCSALEYAFSVRFVINIAVLCRRSKQSYPLVFALFATVCLWYIASTS